MQISPSGRAFEPFDVQVSIGQKAGVNLHTNRFVQFFKKLFGLAFDVNIEGKVYCVNKRSLQKYLERTQILTSAQSLSVEELRGKVQDLHVVSRERPSLESLFADFGTLRSSTEQLMANIRAQKALVSGFPHIESRYAQYEEQAQRSLDVCEELKKNQRLKTLFPRFSNSHKREK